MDTVFIRDLRVETVVGIYDWERRIKQIVSLDLDMGTDIARAANSDRIEDTLDYKTVAKRVAQFVSEAEFQLVETLAEKVAALILEEFKVGKVKVTLHKPGAV
ncbi:MAG: dihydroneopterin aldolase, partial [Gammaproteobacteria bacterium]